jgi:hypothetical protein
MSHTKIEDYTDAEEYLESILNLRDTKKARRIRQIRKKIIVLQKELEKLNG